MKKTMLISAAALLLLTGCSASQQNQKQASSDSSQQTSSSSSASSSSSQSQAQETIKRYVFDSKSSYGSSGTRVEIEVHSQGDKTTLIRSSQFHGLGEDEKAMSKEEIEKKYTDQTMAVPTYQKMIKVGVKLSVQATDDGRVKLITEVDPEKVDVKKAKEEGIFGDSNSLGGIGQFIDKTPEEIYALLEKSGFTAEP